MINLLPIGKAVWEFSKPAVVVAGQVMVGIATVMATSKAIDAIGDGIGYLRGRKTTTTPRRHAKKRGNAKKASGNRKAQVKKVVKKRVVKDKALGEKSTALNS